jgi:hypothetical protein
MASDHENHQLEEPAVEFAVQPQRVPESICSIRDVRQPHPKRKRTGDDAARAFDLFVERLLARAHLVFGKIRDTTHLGILALPANRK